MTERIVVEPESELWCGKLFVRVPAYRVVSRGVVGAPALGRTITVVAAGMSILSETRSRFETCLDSQDSLLCRHVKEEACTADSWQRRQRVEWNEVSFLFSRMPEKG